MLKTIIFDFDGTIANSVDLGAAIFNDLSTKYGYKKVTPEENKAMRDFTIQEMFAKKHVPFYKLPFMMVDVKKELSKRQESIKPITGIKEVLEELKQQSYTLAIITSNNKSNVQKFLDRHTLNVFDSIYTQTSLFGKAKVIDHFLKKYNLKKNEVVYIGDEIRDAEATKKVGIPIIAVTWGLNSRKGLMRVNPEYIIDKPKEITEILSKHFS